MRKTLTLAFIIIAFFGKAQETSVGKSIYGIQIGTFGVFGQNELKLSNSIALRSEIGFDSGFWGGSYQTTGFVMTPVLTLEPRFYYNLKKRNSKSKRIDNNSGNFLSIKTSYHPDWFVISNYDGISIVPDISIVPTWGIRRNIGKHFNYEFGFGIGYRYIFAKRAGYLENEGETTVNLHLRIGYSF